MNISFLQPETRKLWPQRITVKSSEVSYPPLLVDSSISFSWKLCKMATPSPENIFLQNRHSLSRNFYSDFLLFNTTPTGLKIVPKSQNKITGLITHDTKK